MGILFFLLIVTQVSVYSLTTQIENGQDVHCQQITAYYEGTFRQPRDATTQFKAQLQVTAEINLADKHLHFKVDGFNNKYAPDYEFDLFNNTQAEHCYATRGPCSIQYDSGLSAFMVWFMPFDSFSYVPDLLYVKPLSLDNKRFTLLNATRNCATTLQYNHPGLVDPKLYKSCFCCGDKYNPDSSLGCPTSPWS